MLPNMVIGVIQTASKLKSAADSLSNSEVTKFMKNRSMIDVASVARVEPILMIDADCVNLAALADCTQSMHSMFAGYYLQAVNMVQTVQGVSVAQRLAPFNPNTGAAFEDMCLDAQRATSMEDFKFKLPLRSDTKKSLAIEELKGSDKTLEAVKEASNFSVGKVFNVELGAGVERVTVPVAIRLLAHYIPSRVMVELFSSSDVFDMSLKERYHAWRAGRLDFVSDLILCNDLVDKRVKSSIKDPSGVLDIVRQRQSGNNMRSAISGKASVANATNLAIVSSDTMNSVETQMGGPLKNSKVRKALFESSNLMIVAVMDKQWEQVTFWFRGLDSSTTMSFKELKVAGKNDGSNVTDILKAYISGAAPL